VYYIAEVVEAGAEGSMNTPHSRDIYFLVALDCMNLQSEKWYLVGATSAKLLRGAIGLVVGVADYIWLEAAEVEAGKIVHLNEAIGYWAMFVHEVRIRTYTIVEELNLSEVEHLAEQVPKRIAVGALKLTKGCHNCSHYKIEMLKTIAEVDKIATSNVEDMNQYLEEPVCAIQLDDIRIGVENGIAN
jgi:hypothetical protein